MGDEAAPDEAPWTTASRMAARWGQVVVLKGPCTTVAGPSGPAWVYPHPNPALATAGTGDVLAGLTAGLLAQGLSPLDAARLAVVVHAGAGRRVGEKRGWATLLASDLLDEIPAVLAALGGPPGRTGDLIMAGFRGPARPPGPIRGRRVVDSGAEVGPSLTEMVARKPLPEGMGMTGRPSGHVPTYPPGQSLPG